MAYGHPKASIKRLQIGGLNLSKEEGEILWKKNVFFKSVKSEDLGTLLELFKTDYHFYQGKYTSAIHEVLDTNKKTILHIPNVNSGESTKDKHKEVDTIIDSIGKVEKVDSITCVLHVKRKDGKRLKIADLVNDDPKSREKVQTYLRKMSSVDDMDLYYLPKVIAFF